MRGREVRALVSYAGSTAMVAGSNPGVGKFVLTLLTPRWKLIRFRVPISTFYYKAHFGHFDDAKGKNFAARPKIRLIVNCLKKRLV